MRLALILAALILVSGCGTINSQLTLDPETQFVLGGDQRGAFSAELLNVGSVPIRVIERTVVGDTTTVTVLRPGESGLARFARGSAALLVNASRRTATVRATIRGDTNLGMGYVDV